MLKLWILWIFLMDSNGRVSRVEIDSLPRSKDCMKVGEKQVKVFAKLLPESIVNYICVEKK
jgi:hypothetical protein